jgi:hypothetical protein
VANPPRRGLTTIQDVLQSFLKTNGISRSRGVVVAVFQAWEMSIGKDLAKRARPVRFDRGELTVEVDSPAFRHELTSYTGETYRQQTNDILERELVHRMIFKQRG